MTRLLLFFLPVAVWAAAPCTTAAPECTEFVGLGGTARSLVYRTYALDEPNPRITRALVVVHGMGRDADNYFRSALAAAFLAGGLDDTVVIAPRMASNAGGGCRDTLSSGEVSWPCDAWRTGGPATNGGTATSYDFMDAILRKLADKRVFPNMKAIVLTGHSAGGQYAGRYAMSNKVHESLGVPVTYVVSNPSSYPYLDGTRPAPDGSGFRPYADARNCTTYDQWPYGLTGRTGYSASESDAQLRKQLTSRPVTYLLGGLDTTPLAGFDSSCPAMAQGPNRLARGQAFGRFVNEKYGASHTVTVVPMCGHNARCMYTSEAALPILFPR